MDIYKKFINKDVSDTKMVPVGRIASFAALVIAVIAAKPLLGGLDQAFQYIQEFTGFVTPGVVAIFGFGLFWKRASANAALWMAIFTIPLSFGFKLLFEGMPFLNRMGYVFLILAVIGAIISLIENRAPDKKGIKLSRELFRTDTKFAIGAIGLCAIVAALYIIWW
jgi:SSS family solute:Na+ symporter